MSRRSYGYGAYRGRGRGSLPLKILIVLLTAVLLGAVGALLVMEKYVVYDDHGAVHLDLPFLRQEAERTSPEPAPLVPAESAPQPSPAQPDRPEVILPVSVSVDTLRAGTAADAVMEAGGTAALVEMKLESGQLCWVSDQPLAIAARVSRDESEWNRTLSQGTRQEGLYCVARLSCFRDHELSNADPSLALYTASGYRWLDGEGSRWLCPADEQVQDYLIQLCLELAELGFDELLLDNAGYPTQGKLSYIRRDERYDAQSFEQVITGFYTRLTQALEGSGVRLSVVFDPENTALSGQSERVLEELGITRVWTGESGKLVWQAKELFRD